MTTWNTSPLCKLMPVGGGSVAGRGARSVGPIAETATRWAQSRGPIALDGKREAVCVGAGELESELIGELRDVDRVGGEDAAGFVDAGIGQLGAGSVDLGAAVVGEHATGIGETTREV